MDRKDELIGSLGRLAEPYYLARAELLAEELYNLGVERGQAAPRKRGRPAKSEQADSE